MDVFSWLPEQYINEVNIDPFIVGTDSFRGSKVGNFDLGLLGQKHYYSAADVVKYTRTNTAAGSTAETVPMGVQVVRIASSMTATVIRGRPLFWSNITAGNWTVTPDAGAASSTVLTLAGFALNTVTVGRITLMAIAGIVPAIFGTVTKGGTQVVGDGVIWAVASSVGVADVLADATALTSLTGPKVLGRAYGAAPANGAVSYVKLNSELGLPYGGIH